MSGYFYPEMTPRAFRTTELVNELSKKGHKVDLYVPFKGNSHEGFEINENLNLYDLGSNPFKDIPGSKTWLLNFVYKILRRILIMFFEYPNIGLMINIYKKIKNIQDYDLIISIAYPYPIHWGVAAVINRKYSNKRKPIWVADCGDPYFFNVSEVYKKLFYFKYIEKWMFRKVDFISLPRLEMKNNYFEEFHDKIIEIPQGFDLENINRADYSKNEFLTFCYAGTFYPKSRDPRKFIEYILTKIPKFKFIIYTNDTFLIEQFLDDPRIVLRELIPRDNLIFELSKMDFLVNFNFDPVNQSPSKLIDYTISSRPILNVQDNIDYEVIDEFFNFNFQNQFVFENINRYNIKNIAHSFVNLINVQDK